MRRSASWTVLASLLALLLLTVPARATSITVSETDKLDSIPDQIELRRPEPSQLMLLGTELNPLRLDATYDESISLRDTLQMVLDNNLPIRIAAHEREAQLWRMRSALGRFLPDIYSSYSDTWQQGKLSINGGLTLDLHNPYIYSLSQVRYYVFRGGEVMYGALRQRNLLSGQRAHENATVNDTYLEATRRYYNLLLHEALLQIQVKAVQTSEELYSHNQQLKLNGVTTRLEVLQAKAQLARDRQDLLNAEFELRAAAIALANTLNLSAAPHISTADTTVVKRRLIDSRINIQSLLNMALDHRPELKQLEQERLAARKAIQIAMAPLLPRASLTGSIIGSGSTVSPSSITSAPSYAAVAVSGTGTTANVLGNVAGGLPAAALGYPLASAGVQTVYPAAVVQVPSQSVSTRIRSEMNLGWMVEWDLPGMGMPAHGQVQAARIDARTAMLRLNQKVLDVIDEVRVSYVRSLTAERIIEQASDEVLSAEEELRVAQERMDNGIGINLDVITGQRDLTQALVKKAQAIIEFNEAQVQLLRDLGMISIDSVCSGRLLSYAGGNSSR